MIRAATALAYHAAGLEAVRDDSASPTNEFTPRERTVKNLALNLNTANGTQVCSLPFKHDKTWWFSSGVVSEEDQKINAQYRRKPHGAIRASQCMRTGRHYWAVHVKWKLPGYDDRGGEIAFGICAATQPFSRDLPVAIQKSYDGNGFGSNNAPTTDLDVHSTTQYGICLPPGPSLPTPTSPHKSNFTRRM